MSNKIYWHNINLKGELSSQAATIAKHLTSRFDSGHAYVVCEHPASVIPALNKAWKKSIAKVQQERDKAPRTDDKLRLTRRVIKMQSYRIGPAGSSSQLSVIDFPSFADAAQDSENRTIYIVGTPPASIIRSGLENLVRSILIVGNANAVINSLASPKAEIDLAAEKAWQNIVKFLHTNNIRLDNLVKPNDDRVAQINVALEVLLDDQTSRQFIDLVNSFNAAARFAAPLIWSKKRMDEQQTIAVLANQVASFTPDLNHDPLATGEDPVFFLSDKKVLTINMLTSYIKQVSSSYNLLATERLLAIDDSLRFGQSV